MRQQSEGKVGEDHAPIMMRARGKTVGQLDPKTLRLSLKRGRITLVFDLRATLKAGRAVEVGKQNS